MIDFKCPGCAKSFSVKDDLAGRKTKCPKCGAAMRVPAAPVASANQFEIPPDTADDAPENEDAQAPRDGASVTAVIRGCSALLGLLLITSVAVIIAVVVWKNPELVDFKKFAEVVGPKAADGGDLKVADGGGGPKIADGGGGPKAADGGGPKVPDGGVGPKAADGGVGPKAADGGGGPKDGEAFKGKAMEVTAKEISDAYEANGVAAAEKYKGKTVQTEGVLQSIGTNYDGKPLLFIHSGFNCYFGDKHKAEAAKLSKGQIIAVQGILEGPNLTMKKCEFVEAKPIKLEFSAFEFGRERRADPNLANARYGGKTLTVTGKLTHDPRGGLSVGLDSGDKQGLACFFEAIHREKLRDLSKRQNITLRGKLSDFGRLDKCELIAVTPIKLVQLRAQDLLQQWQKDRNRTNTLYDGETLLITGTVTGVTNQGGWQIFFGEGNLVVACHFDEPETPGNVFKGKAITVRGIYQDFLHHVMLRSCRVVK